MPTLSRVVPNFRDFHPANMPAPLTAIPRSSPVSGRLRDHLGELNRVVADPHLGSSLEQIEEGMSELQITPGVMDPTPPSM